MASSAQDIARCRALAAQGKDFVALSNVCGFALTAQRRLPDFRCEQKTTRYRQKNSIVMAPETVTALVTFERGGEHYSNIRVNGVRAGQAMEDLPGGSTGEFGTALIGIFHPASQATFSFRGESAAASGTMLVYDFRVLRENNAVWHLKVGNVRTFPGYHGSVWVEKDNGLLRRLELKAADSEIDSALFLSSVDISVDYAFTQLSELGIYLLPVGSETSACSRNSKCSRSVLEFHNCHKFAAKTRILPDSKP